MFRLPHYGDVSFGYLEYHTKTDPKDHIALFTLTHPVTASINACVVDTPQAPRAGSPLLDDFTGLFSQEPRAGSLLWDDFTVVYYDPDVGCENPVDQKVMQVGAAGGREA